MKFIAVLATFLAVAHAFTVTTPSNKFSALKAAEYELKDGEGKINVMVRTTHSSHQSSTRSALVHGQEEIHFQIFVRNSG